MRFVRRQIRIERAKSLILCLIVAVIMNGCKRDVSGKYLGKFSNGILWLQLVRTPDDRLTGQVETAVLQPDGKIERTNVAVAGAVNGSDVTLTARSLGIQVLSLSGAFEGNKLRLTGGQPSPLLLERSDLNEYSREAKSLDARSQRIILERNAIAARQSVAQTLNEFVASVDAVLARMRTFSVDANAHLNKFPAAEERYSAITAKMNEYVNRAHELGGNRNAAVARGQLAVAVNQASIGTDQLHNSVQSLQLSLRSNVQPLTAQAGSIEAACHHAVTPGDLTQAQIATRSAACERLLQAIGPFREKIESVERGLIRLEQTYTRERKTQDALLQASQRLE
jgi:hypothetical protein